MESFLLISFIGKDTSAHVLAFYIQDDSAKTAGQGRGREADAVGPGRRRNSAGTDFLIF